MSANTPCSEEVCDTILGPQIFQEVWWREVSRDDAVDARREDDVVAEEGYVERSLSTRPPFAVKKSHQTILPIPP
jgi:hypothetical protein